MFMLGLTMIPLAMGAKEAPRSLVPQMSEDFKLRMIAKPPKFNDEWKDIFGQSFFDFYNKVGGVHMWHYWINNVWYKDNEGKASQGFIVEQCPKDPNCWIVDPWSSGVWRYT